MRFKSQPHTHTVILCCDLSTTESDSELCTAPVSVADRALPVCRSHADAALAADAVAAAVAHCSRVPELSQRPLAAGAGPLAVLPGETLRPSPPKLLELVLHPPEMRESQRGLSNFHKENIRHNTTTTMLH